MIGSSSKCHHHHHHQQQQSQPRFRIHVGTSKIKDTWARDCECKTLQDTFALLGFCAWTVWWWSAAPCWSYVLISTCTTRCRGPQFIPCVFTVSCVIQESLYLFGEKSQNPVQNDRRHGAGWGPLPWTPANRSNKSIQQHFFFNSNWLKAALFL